ncbi:histidine kinase [Mucilaginibacter sp. 21P]|uniref:sensor histidine kinase n=1 Tax=Mucilaginibacter sp. 21P TaxID=2778902 RepID=UPI001C58366B|nr:histidine kinase [Mucilaginibacter sp. 21P]QXV63904.1 histidine kinase [Mucilaginibacter sp. 21P]
MQIYRFLTSGKLYLHIAVWVIFIAYELSYLSMVARLGKWYDYAIHYALNIGLVYLNTYFLNYVRPKRYRIIKMTIIIAAEISAYIIIHFIIVHFFSRFDDDLKKDMLHIRLTIIQEFYRALYFTGISLAYWFSLSLSEQKKMVDELNTEKLLQEKIQAELEKNLMKAKTAYLQSQLNPHLLFNTLNFIYNSVRKISEDNAYAILLLAEIMRYSLSDIGEDGKVSLKKEIDHIYNLVKLNQLRFNKELNLKMRVNGDFDDEKIIPLLLLTFIENIYKHGDLTDPDMPAIVTIRCDDNQLYMHYRNKKRKYNVNKGWGIGIENAKTRLDIYYPQKHNISINDSETEYQLEINLTLA